MQNRVTGGSTLRSAVGILKRVTVPDVRLDAQRSLNLRSAVGIPKLGHAPVEMLIAVWWSHPFDPLWGY
jgi:hypothetical protein